MHEGSTLVVVAAGTVGRFLMRARPGARLVEFDELRLDIEGAAPERDSAPRFPRSQQKTEHRPSAHDSAAEKFIAHVLRRTIDVFRAERSAQLILCAPPTTLGLLRADLTQDLKERLALAIDKDITKETPAAIDRRLRELCT